MSRGKGGKTYSKDSIVIVCEGTETEYPYFEQLCQSHDGWRVVPNQSEQIDRKRKKSRKIKSRKLKKGDSREFLEYEYYVGLPEENKVLYDTYKYEPLKWVRAAQLFKERYRYYEAWAVYDLDQEREVYHPKAYEHAAKVDNLHIAFSAYSFEEWLLLHYERNSMAFVKSECKGANKKKVNCGLEGNESELNCHGKKCLGGRLREQKYIKDYDKSEGAKILKATKGRRHVAYVNAAWVRSLSGKEIYERNPYTDVDKLVMRLLNENYEIQWVKIGDVFKVSGEQFKIVKDGNDFKLKYVGGKSLVRLKAGQLYWCDDKYNKSASIIDTDQYEFDPENLELVLNHRPTDTSVLCIKAGKGKEYYFEMN